MQCRLCGNNQLRLYYRQGHRSQFKFYKCRQCGLVNLDLESVDIYKNQRKYAEKYLSPFERRNNKGSWETYDFIAKHLPNKGKYMDIGCGNGALLYRAREDGWKVEGLEISSFLAQKIQETLNIDVAVENFMQLSIEDHYTKQFDLISLRHVLEHIPDSVVAMQKINMLLKKGAHALIEIPNIEGVSLKNKRLLSRLGLGKKYDESYVPGHCNEFSIKPFRHLIEKTGFRLIHWETYSGKAAAAFFNKHFKLGSKARALIQKTQDI